MILTDVASTFFRTNVPPSGSMPDLKQIANDKLSFARFYTVEYAPFLRQGKTCTILIHIILYILYILTSTTESTTECITLKIIAYHWQLVSNPAHCAP